MSSAAIALEKSAADSLAVAILRDGANAPPPAMSLRSRGDEGLFCGKLLDPHNEEPAKRASRTMRPGLFTSLHAMVLS